MGDPSPAVHFVTEAGDIKGKTSMEAGKYCLPDPCHVQAKGKWRLSNRLHVCRARNSPAASVPSPLMTVPAGSSTGGAAHTSLRGLEMPHKCTSNGSCHKYGSRDAVEVSMDAVPHELARGGDNHSL